MKYEFIESYVGEYSISLMCRTLEVSRGGYYKWCHHTPSERSKRRERFEQLVMCTFAQYRARYGSVRIAEELNEAGHACCVNYVADIMKEKGIRARNGKGFKYNILLKLYCGQNANKLFKSDSARVAFLLCVGFSG
ncbi:TPA: IS3 family transposase [Vibrio campbellii]